MYKRQLSHTGGFIVTNYGAPRNKVFAVQIEINRSLYLDPDSRTIDLPALERTVRCFEEFFERLPELAPSQ